MRELSLYPNELAEMSVAQLAALAPQQLLEANTNLGLIVGNICWHTN